jgi:phosphoribosylpyrophosphate synthetase
MELPIAGVFVTDTIHQAQTDWPQLHVVSVGSLIAGAIQRVMANGSISDLF